jgi:glycosyltransferase involved in cell wall biosynthesis
MKKLLILAAHQSHVRENAGGYIRIKQFLRFVPSDMTCFVVDIEPTIYSGLKNVSIVSIPVVSFINRVKRFSFIYYVLLERIHILIHSFLSGFKVIRNEKIHCIYVPIGELLHLYLPAILLKACFPNTYLVIDILNFENINISTYTLFKRFKSAGYRLQTAIILAFVHKITFLIHKLSINCADYIVTVSQFLVNSISEIYNKKTILFTPSGVDSREYEPSFTKQKKYTAVYVGRVTEQKGMYNLINAWSKVVKFDKTALLAIAGIISDSDNSALVIEINKRGLERNIKLFGEVDEDNKIEIISNSKIFLHLANYEPLFPVIGILEGLALGLPVIVFDNAAFSPEDRKIAAESTFISIIENNNFDGVAQKVYKLINLDKSANKRIFDSAIKYAAKFDWKEISKIEFGIINRKFNT